jgi:hypothetical protein
MLSRKGKKLVFLLSLPRSGSTLLSLLLGNHSTIYCPPEPWFLLKLFNFYRQASSDSVYDDVLTSTGTKEFLQPDIFIEAGRAFATKAYNMHLSISGKTIFIDKTPRYYHILSFIAKLFPEAKYIWLKRNPLDIASSYLNNWKISIDEITGEKVTPYSYDFAKGLFDLEAFFLKRSPIKYEMQYEELVKNTQHSLTKLCDFLNLDFEDKMLSYAQNEELIALHRSAQMGDKMVLLEKAPHTNSIERWIKNISKADMQKIVDLLGFDIFQRMGYGETIKNLKVLGVKSESESKSSETRQKIGSINLDRLLVLEQQLHEVEADSAARMDQIYKLNDLLNTCENDRAERHKVIEKQQHKINRLEDELEKLRNMS